MRLLRMRIRKKAKPKLVWSTDKKVKDAKPIPVDKRIKVG